MIEQLKTIRAGLETATCYSMLGADAHSVQIALTALTQLEAMVGEQEPVAWTTMIEIDWAKRNPGRAGSFYAVKEGPSSIPLYTAAPVAQQPRQCGLCGSDEAFTGTCGGGKNNPRALCYETVAQQPSDDWVLIATNAYEAGFGKGEQAAERGVEISNPWSDEPAREAWAIGYELGKERYKPAQQPQAEPDIHEARGQIEFLDKKNNALLAAIHKVMARLADLLDEDQFKEIEETISSAGVQPQEEPHQECDSRPICSALKSCAGQYGSHRICGSTPQQAEAVPTDAELIRCWVEKTPGGEIDGIASMRKVLEKFGSPQQAEAVPVAWDNCRAEYQCRSWCGNSSCVSHAAQGAKT